MKTTLIILSCLIIVVCILLFILSGVSKQGQAPKLVEGRLSNCSEKPNCVCSENEDDLAHYVAPLSLSHSNAEDSTSILKQIIIEMGGTIQTENAAYLAATFSSTVFGFIDDLEIRIDSMHELIHIRSASRVGHSDMGVNKKRVELLKQLYQQKTEEID